MLPIPWQIGLLAALLALSMGLLLGLSLGTLFSAALRRRRRYALDGASGMVGAMAGLWLSVASGKFAVELNGAVVGWQTGAHWPRLRTWASGHALFVAIVGCVVCIALGRALATATVRLRALKAARDAKA
jgi:hypothetical protein